VASDPAAVEQKASERRANTRVELEVEVGLESDHNFYTGLTQDISSGGIFVATPIHFRVGDQVSIKFTLPGHGSALAADAEVRWLRDPHVMRTDAPEGIGLRFLSLSPDVQAAIARFLESRDSLFYDDL